MAENVTLACVKHGSAYGPEYVNILLDMCARNLPDDFAYTFACFTENAEGLDPRVDVRPLPEGLTGWWNKLALFTPEAFPAGTRVFYFDLDTVITDELDAIVKYRGPFAILRDFYRPSMYQSAVMSWEAGTHDHIWTRWNEAGRPQTDDGDQFWIQGVIQSPDIWQDMFPDMFASYKINCEPDLARGAHVVCFHGEPRPHDIAKGWVADTWRIGRTSRPGNMAQTIPIHCNVNDTDLKRNILLAAKLDRPWLDESEPHNGRALIVGGGPSVRAFLGVIKHEQERGAAVFSVNGAMGLLSEAGIRSDYFAMLDGRPESTEFVERGEADHYLIASQCDPSVYRLLSDKLVTVWHSNYGGVPELLNTQRSYVLVSGGSTVGLQTMSIAYAKGYRDIHLYGFDSSYTNGQGHAYPQALNDRDTVIEYQTGGVKFLATPWMVRQAMEFQIAASQLATADCDVTVHGFGLLPTIARQMAQLYPPQGSNQLAATG